MSSLLDETKNDNTKSKKLLFIILAGLALCCLVGVVVLVYFLVISPKSMLPQLVKPVLPTTSNLGPGDDFSLARSYIRDQNNCTPAMPLLDDVIDREPENGEAHYLRSHCYFAFGLQDSQLGSFELALEDIDKAILYGVADPSMAAGDLYYYRYMILSELEAQAVLRSDRDYLNQIMLDNLKTAVALGNSDSTSHRLIPLTLFDMNRCEEGIAALDWVRHKEGLSAPPSPTLYNEEAQGYFCVGDYEKALEYVDKGLSLNSLPERVYFRAVILYHLGRLEESLDVLNQLVDENPTYDNYVLRALIRYEMGERDLAQQDLRTAQPDTSSSGLNDYVLGLMALDDHNKEQAVQYLQQADAKLVWLYYPLLPKIEDKLKELGSEPMPQKVISNVVSTPMVVPTLEPPPDYPLNKYGFQFPPSPILANIEDRLNPVNISGQKYFTYYFQPPTLLHVESVQKLTVHMLSAPDSKDTPIFLLLWQPTTGDWRVIPATPKDNVEVDDPGSCVDNVGVIYASIYVPQGRSIDLYEFWVTLEATATDGSAILLDVGKSQ